MPQWSIITVGLLYIYSITAGINYWLFTACKRRCSTITICNINELSFHLTMNFIWNATSYVFCKVIAGRLPRPRSNEHASVFMIAAYDTWRSVSPDRSYDSSYRSENSHYRGGGTNRGVSYSMFHLASLRFLCYLRRRQNHEYRGWRYLPAGPDTSGCPSFIIAHHTSTCASRFRILGTLHSDIPHHVRNSFLNSLGVKTFSLACRRFLPRIQVRRF